MIRRTGTTMMRTIQLLFGSFFLLLLKQQQLFVSGQYFDGFDAFAQSNKKCKLYSCEKGYEPVPNKKMIFQSPGCDAMGSGNLDLFGGDEEEDEDGKPYEDCCHEWHACQQICGISKQSCDDAYTQCTEEKCIAKGKKEKDKQKGKETESYCLEQAKQSMMMNNLAGCKNFELTQSKACSCVTKYGDRHMKQRQEALYTFYKKYAPEGTKKVKDLVKKADTMTKMAKLLQKLIRKYPESIELVEDPQTKMYRQMFGNAGFGGAGGADAFGDAFGGGAGAGGDDFDDNEDLGAYGEDDEEDDFDVNEDLGSYGDEEEEEEEVTPPPPKREKKKPEKKKKDPPPPPPVEEEEEEPYDEFDQYQEL